MGWLEGKIVYITGGGSGIGKAIVDRFIAEGAKVSILDRSQDHLEQLNRQYPSDVVTYCGDVRNFEDHQEAIHLAVKRWGKLDGLIANAGIFDGFITMKNMTPEVLDQSYQQLFDVNVKGYFFAAKAALSELMKSQGNIIFSLSGASFYPDGGGTIYTATKHAALGLLRQLAFELAPTVRVNGVALGGTITELKVSTSLKDLTQPVNVEEKKRSIQSRNPMQMFMTPEDHVATYVLLASDQAPAITGEVIHSDGGLTVRGLG